LTSRSKPTPATAARFLARKRSAWSNQIASAGASWREGELIAPLQSSRRDGVGRSVAKALEQRANGWSRHARRRPEGTSAQLSSGES
jgi:hypothetical protein